MKIKSFILALSLTGLSIMAFAQKELTTAKTNYDNYQGLKGKPGVEKLSGTSIRNAKDAIDKAVANPKLQADPSMWSYRALIYGDLALLDSVETRTAPLMTEALTAITKATELDKDGANKVSVESAKLLVSQYHLNMGVGYFKGKDYSKAYTQMKEGLEFSPKDSVLTLYSALMALYGKDYKNAIEQYKAAVSNKQINPEVYNNLIDLYAVVKDTASAIRTATEGSALFPKDNAIATKEIEYSLMIGKTKEIIDKISKQAQNEPTNKLFPYYLGLAYSSTDDNTKAEEAYKKSIEIDPKFAEPYINLGSLILNNGILAYNAANKLPQNQQAAYTEGMKKANAEFERAFPYLLKATELSPKSRLAFTNLRTYYNVKKDMTKSAEITKILEGLPN